MAEFMVLIHDNDGAGGALSPAETRQLFEQQAAYQQKLRGLAVVGDAERRRPSSEGRRVSRDPERGVLVVEGPFGAPTLDAYYVFEAPDLDAALALAAECPLPPGAQAEVRPVKNGHFEPEKMNRKGRMFAFAVLSAAPNECSWIEVMDHIDEQTRTRFPEHQFRGGARLEAPSRGQKLSPSGGRRAVFDG